MIKTYASDDYAGLNVVNMEFYYGYEYQFMVNLNSDSNVDDSWGFVFLHCGEIVKHFPMPKDFDFPERQLLKGIGQLIEDGDLKISDNLLAKGE